MDLFYRSLCCHIRIVTYAMALSVEGDRYDTTAASVETSAPMIFFKKGGEKRQTELNFWL